MGEEWTHFLWQRNGPFSYVWAIYCFTMTLFQWWCNWSFCCDRWLSHIFIRGMAPFVTDIENIYISLTMVVRMTGLDSNGTHNTRINRFCFCACMMSWMIRIDMSCNMLCLWTYNTMARKLCSHFSFFINTVTVILKIVINDDHEIQLSRCTLVRLSTKRHFCVCCMWQYFIIL